jgi:Arc/MetJ-type ribon-helix-helix transcriptional regulator
MTSPDETETTLFQGGTHMREKSDVPCKYTVTPSMALHMRQRIRDGAFASEAEYIRSLIRADLDAWARWKLSGQDLFESRPE